MNTSLRQTTQKPGHQLYDEFHERNQRLYAVQEAQRLKLEHERLKSKVNFKSHELAYRKLERELGQAIAYVDYEGTNSLNLTQIGQLLYLLSVFKYLYNQQYEEA